MCDFAGDPKLVIELSMRLQTLDNLNAFFAADILFIELKRVHLLLYDKLPLRHAVVPYRLPTSNVIELKSS